MFDLFKNILLRLLVRFYLNFKIQLGDGIFLCYLTSLFRNKLNNLFPRRCGLLGVYLKYSEIRNKATMYLWPKNYCIFCIEIYFPQYEEKCKREIFLI